MLLVGEYYQRHILNFSHSVHINNEDVIINNNTLYMPVKLVVGSNITQTKHVLIVTVDNEHSLPIEV